MEKREKKVLCVGKCCLDIVMFCKSYPLEDSDQSCISHNWQRGGNASNSCTIFAEFNIPCEILGTMGCDNSGQFMKDNFEKQNISTENCRFYPEYESTTAVILINAQNGSRTIVSSDTKLPEVSFEDFKHLDLNNYSWIHFESRPNVEDIKAMVQHIRQWNAKQSNNIRISIEIEKPRPKAMEFLTLGDVVFISKDFAIACGHANMASAVEALYHNLRPEAIIICAWGEKGASAKRVDGPVLLSKAYSPAEIVTTLGAGDTFIAATIIALMKGQDLSMAIDTGCRVAGAKCGMHDTTGLAKLFPLL